VIRPHENLIGLFRFSRREKAGVTIVPSYLLNNRRGNDYPRIPLPQSPRLLGCPRAIRPCSSKIAVRPCCATGGWPQSQSADGLIARALNCWSSSGHDRFRDLVAPVLARLRPQRLSSADGLIQPSPIPSSQPDDVSSAACCDSPIRHRRYSRLLYRVNIMNQQEQYLGPWASCRLSVLSAVEG